MGKSIAIAFRQIFLQMLGRDKMHFQEGDNFSAATNVLGFTELKILVAKGGITKFINTNELHSTLIIMSVDYIYKVRKKRISWILLDIVGWRMSRPVSAGFRRLSVNCKLAWKEKTEGRGSCVTVKC